jgi:DNA-binding beta-propeller fold protein YncE
VVKPVSSSLGRFRRKGLLILVAPAAAFVVYCARPFLPHLGKTDGCDRRYAVFAQEKKPLGGDLIPLRQVVDPYAVFNGIAVDPQNNLLVMTDVNRKSLLAYDRTAVLNQRDGMTPTHHQIFGPETNIGFVAGVVLDPERREIYAVNNDIEDTLVVMPYGAEGNAAPKRILSVPHQAWGLALGRSSSEIAVTVELHQAIVFYRQDAHGVERPRRFIRGADTGLADPHGVYWDESRHEIGAANHGNFRGLVHDVGAGCVPTGSADLEGGAVKPPSITIYAADAQGNQKPLRTIQGERTHLDFPMGIAVDEGHGEIAVANNGDNSLLIFQRTATGDAAPVRVISGDKTGINRPMGAAIDTRNGEIWVSNFADHSAVAFDRMANGNVAPKRIIRTAPPGTPSPGFGNPQTVAYDGKREQILVPN